jgi:ribonuclease BN (tRNA processing enzyme)
VKLTFLGVRGSTSAPGAAFNRYGGHTSCVAVTADEARNGPTLLLDAGTGVSDLPQLLGGRPYTGSIVLSHLHWDHVYGLPFCSSLDHPESRVDLWIPMEGRIPAVDAGGGGDARGGGDAGDGGDGAARRLLSRAMSPPHFPIGPEQLLGSWRFLDQQPGRLAIEDASDLRVTVAPIAHKGGVTYGVRVELDGASVAYLPDHALADPALLDGVPTAELTSAEALVSGADVLLHDGQFREDEQALAIAYGHATMTETMRLADRCGVGELVLTHHAPGRTDDELDDLAATLTATPQGRPVHFARQGQVLVVKTAPDRLRRPSRAPA